MKSTSNSKENVPGFQRYKLAPHLPSYTEQSDLSYQWGSYALRLSLRTLEFSRDNQHNTNTKNFFLPFFFKGFCKKMNNMKFPLWFWHYSPGWIFQTRAQESHLNPRTRQSKIHSKQDQSLAPSR